MVNLGIRVYLIKPGVATSAVITAIQNKTKTNQGGYVNPTGTPTNIHFFKFNFTSKARSLSHDVSITNTPSQGQNAIGMRKIQWGVQFKDAHIGNLNDEPETFDGGTFYTTWFIQGLNYALVEWIKLSNKYATLLRVKNNDPSAAEFDGTYLWHYPTTSFKIQKVIFTDFSDIEDVHGNVNVSVLTLKGGKLS